MTNLLEVKDVYAGYIKDLNILQGINFCIQPGELITVIGPNGAGKSTLAKTIFGLLTPNQGEIIFKDRNIAGLKSNEIVKLGMCYVPQRANVFATLTVEENLEMGAYTLSGSCKKQKEMVYTMFPKLKERFRQKAGTLSGGERQMLAMGKALMLDPDLLLLDEPSAALSPILVNDVFEQIKAINATGKAIVLVEQNAKKALMMADRGYVLESGKDAIEGKGSDLLDNPLVGELYLGTRHE
ncbi:ABC transporter related protein [Cyanobacterium stanieri PCC 7202]|uniref:ABC transporter related protein n=1 Tax=Cyanobacterium stanieri (strain ATCC 29140 / PCC 7202) TaxID=292563 RepID=K9YQ39_CYASC|nr:ABC transporter related protein [Cyanobacterium stanieri PCC 7202]